MEVLKRGSIFHILTPPPPKGSQNIKLIDKGQKQEEQGKNAKKNEEKREKGRRGIREERKNRKKERICFLNRQRETTPKHCRLLNLFLCTPM